MSTAAAVTVLRIKRKATEPPLSSLVIQDDNDRATKRAKGPVVAPPRAAGVFRLAETVSQQWRGDGPEAEALKTRISTLLATPSLATETPVSSSAALASNQTGDAAGSAQSAADLALDRRYRVIRPKKSMRFPPVVRDSDAPPDPFRFVDAQAEMVQQPHVPSATWVPPGALDPPKPQVDSGDSSDEDAVEGLAGGGVQPARASNMNEEEVDAFLPMLKEYLSLDRPSLPHAPSVPRKQVSLKPSSTTNNTFTFAPLEEPEWVYDLYYRDTRPEGMPLSLGAGDGVGALLGLDDLDDGSGSDVSEEEDEADEDSNEEDFYRNDYPEDEDSSDDEAGYAAYARRQAYEDGGWSDDEPDGDAEGADEDNYNMDD